MPLRTALATLVLGAMISSDAHAGTVLVLQSDHSVASRELAAQVSAQLPGLSRVTVDLSTNPSLAGQTALLGGPPDAVVAVGDAALIQARASFASAPLIYTLVKRPVANGPALVRVAPLPDPQVVAARLHVLLPTARRVGALRQPTDRDPWWDDAAAAFRREGLELVPSDVASDAEVPNALEHLYPTTDAVWLLPDARLLPPALVARVLHSAALGRDIVIGHSRAQIEGSQPAPVVVIARSEPAGVVIAKRVQEAVASAPLGSGYATPTLLGDREALRSCGAIVNQRTAAAVDEWVR